MAKRKHGRVRKVPVEIAGRRPLATHRYIGHCTLTGKAQFISKQDAKAARRLTPGNLYVYSCEACGYFELGSKGGRPRSDHRVRHREKVADQR
jgi:hypothetical protein